MTLISQPSLRSRSRVTITDTSKTGTVLNGTKFASSSRDLSTTETIHSFQLGTCEEQFRIRWVPVVLTLVSFHQLRKQIGTGDPAQHVHTLLGKTDIKLTTGFEAGVTTHVVVNKRNTSTGLQALIDGSFIVLDSYINVLVTATTPTPTDGGRGPSPLEVDFDLHWPDPISHLPPVGKEPVPRPADMFRPNPARRDIFKGLVFVFLDGVQYESLRETVEMGTGKAIHVELKEGESSSDDVIERARRAVSGPRTGDAFLESVIVVRARAEDGWIVKLQREVGECLRKDLLAQNALLDLVLMADVSAVRQLKPGSDGE